MCELHQAMGNKDQALDVVRSLIKANQTSPAVWKAAVMLLEGLNNISAEDQTLVSMIYLYY